MESENISEIVVGVYWYEDDNGERVYDFEEMRNEFERKLREITGDKYEGNYN